MLRIGPSLRLSVMLVLALFLGQSALSLYVDALWFRELGAEHRFWTEIYARWGLTLAGIVACQVGNVFCCRTIRQSVFKVGFFRNRLVLLGIAVETCLILCLVYLPFFQSIFGLAPLALRDWGVLATFPFIMLGCEELRKLFIRLGEKRKAGDLA